jgi:CubicO group peptidase (beta-lactamase class C family)
MERTAMSFFRLTLSLVSLAAVMSVGSTAQAQSPTLPSPESTNPVTLELMKGFPPPPDKVVRLGTILKYPNARWAFHNLRELGPTAAVWRGAGAASPLLAAPRELEDLSFDDGKGSRLTIADWQRNTYTDGLLVLHKGKVVYERSDVGMLAQQPHVLWSMSKSLTGLLATELIREGVIDAGALVSTYLPELKDSAWGDATVQQTLDMTTGVQYQENFSDPASGIFQYLIAAGLLPLPPNYPGPKTVTDFLKTVKKEGQHGSAFQYKTVDTEVIGWLLQRVTKTSYADLLSQRLWAPLGAQEDGYVWVDPAGAQLSSVGVSATMRDLGRLGEMMRMGGRYNGRQVLSAATVAEIRKGADPEKFKAAGMSMRAGYSYHNQWWIPHDADGTFEAKGLNGQHIHINPAAQLVVVKLSSHPVPNTAFTHTLDRQAFAALAVSLNRR